MLKLVPKPTKFFARDACLYLIVNGSEGGGRDDKLTSKVPHL